MYHFVSGYELAGGTERGIVGRRLLSQPASVRPSCLCILIYAEMLGERIEKHNARVYLINTGWSGGKYGVGKRISIKHTRAMVTAALSGELENGEFELDPVFNVLVPKAVNGVPNEVLSPREMWADKSEYDKTAKELATRFVENFKKYNNMPKHIIDAGPKG